MKDIKSLYLEARNGSSLAIKSYTEGVNEILSTPNDYLANSEYIINSEIGLSTLNEFVEKYGLAIPVYNSILEKVEKCISKCEKANKDSSKYQEAKAMLEAYHDKYKSCFEMFEYYSNNEDTTFRSDIYTEMYYSFNDKNIQNNHLVGMIDRFGESAIPDMLITASKINQKAMNSVFSYIESKYNNPIMSQWIMECANDSGISNYTTESTSFDKIRSSSPLTIYNSMKERNLKVFKEAMLMGDDVLMDYTTEEVDAIKDLISFKEYQMTCCESTETAMNLQKEIYSLYEEFDGMEENQFLESKEDKDKKAVMKKCFKNLSEISKISRSKIGKAIKTGFKEANHGRGIFNKFPVPSVSTMYGDKHGKFYGLFGNRRKTSEILIEEYKSTSQTLENLFLYVDFTFTTDYPMSKELKTSVCSVMNDSIEEAVKELKSESTIGFMKSNNVTLELVGFNKKSDKNGNIEGETKKEDDNYKTEYTQTYTYYTTTWTIRLPLSKDSVFYDVDLSRFSNLNEAVELVESMTSAEFEEMVADSVAPMLPEATWVGNSLDKKTSGIPTYIAQNHSMASYGEDDGPNDNKDDEEKTLEDYRRPSANKSDTKPTSDPGDDDEPEFDNPLTSDEDNKPTAKETQQQAINNYYYNYYNSLNKTNNRDDHSVHNIKKDSHNTDDHSVRNTRTDDHSSNKRINSDNINNSSTSEEHDAPSLEESFKLVGFENFLKPSVINESEFSEGVFDTIKGGVKKMMNSIKGFIGKKLNLPRLQSLDKPSEASIKLPPTLIGTNIPINQSAPVPKESSVNRIAPKIESTDIEELLEAGYYISESPDRDEVVFRGLSKNDIKNVINKLRSKFNAEILFVHAGSNASSLIGPAALVETDRKSIEKLTSGKKILTQVPSMLNNPDNLKLEKVILINPKELAAFNIKTTEHLELVISHEYGHFLTWHQISPIDQVEYMIKRQTISGIPSLFPSLGISNSDINLYYYKLKPERLANEAVGINPTRLCEIMFGSPPKKINGIDMDVIVNWKMPEIVMTVARIPDASQLTRAQFMASVDATKDLYSKCITDPSLQKYALDMTDNAANIGLKYLKESLEDDEPDRPKSDHPVRETLQDIDRATVKLQQKAKKGVQNVQNVGRAFVKPVKRTQQWINHLISTWKDADETLIKEKLADPHARKNIFSAVGEAIKQGSLLKAGILLNPVFLFLSITKGIGNKQREGRIRNEMIAELKTEMEIIQEKIKDADDNHDNKAKYQLMRLKNELNKKMSRVAGIRNW